MKTLKSRHYSFRGLEDVSLCKNNSQELYDLIGRLLQPVPKDRLTLNQVWTHPFMMRKFGEVPTIPRPIALESLKTLISFSLNSSRFYQLVSAYMTYSLMPKSTRSTLFKHYEFFDTTKIGYVGIPEIEKLVEYCEIEIPSEDM